MSLVNQFRRSKVIITDRLHGLILAAITNTPCIVMRSLDTKVIGTYEWIKEIDFIKYIDKDGEENIARIANQMMKEYEPYQWGEFRAKYFDNLRERIGT